MTSKPKKLKSGNPDMVNSPPHYAKGGVECIDAIQASMTDKAFAGYLKGNIQKYIWRYENKGKKNEDLEKANWYIKKLIVVEKNIKEDLTDFNPLNVL
tara:strand:+ start:333 stop:626 length:294 start_codon:yes stop_codon:yes gene_type:complete